MPAPLSSETNSNVRGGFAASFLQNSHLPAQSRTRSARADRTGSCQQHYHLLRLTGDRTEPCHSIMPHKHSRKVYIEDGHYHVYNRGVEKRKIFEDDQDYRVFLHLLKYYLSPTSQNAKHPIEESTDQTLIRPRPLANLHKEVDLLAYCLMPNHFHLLIKQITKNGMPKLIRSLASTYSMYFNKRYKRVGYLFQGRYKAALVTEDNYLLHLSRYIHLNPVKLTGPDLVTYPYSSYQYYLGEKTATWVKPRFILSYFKKSDKHPSLERVSSYKAFVESSHQDDKEFVGDLAID